LTIKVEADNNNDVKECNESNNVKENEFKCPGPDLIIADKHETALDNCSFTVTYTVENIGECNASASDTTIYINDVNVLEDPVGELAAGKDYTNTVGPFSCTSCEILNITVEADNGDDVTECNESNNNKTNTYVCPGPDLIVFEKYETGLGDGRFNVTYTVMNIGDCKAGASKTTITVEGTATEYPAPPLSLDQCYTDTVGPFDCEPCMTVTVIVKADSDDDVTECNETNNEKTNTFVCPGPGPGKPDLDITAIWVVDNRIHYTIRNIGGEPAPRSYTGLYINGIYRARDRVAPLAVAGERDEVFGGHNYRGGDIEVCADYRHRVDEANEGNNCMDLGGDV
jgi:subtilase family serine protease